MFGVGLHCSLKDLLAVRTIAVPGAIAQIAVASGLGIALGLSLGWSFAGSAIFGLALSVASTVVLLRALQARDMVETEKRSEEHTSELQSLMRRSYAVFRLTKKTYTTSLTFNSATADTRVL